MSKQSVFQKSNKFVSLESSDSEAEYEPKVIVKETLENSITFKKNSKNDTIAPAEGDDWEEVRGNTKKISPKFKGNSSNQHKPKSNYKQPHKGGGGKKSEAMATHDKKARNTIHSLIEKLVSGVHIDDVAYDLKNAIDEETGHYAKGKLLEIATSYLLHELLAHDLIKPYFSENNVREGDGHTALFWVAWSEYFKYSEKLENDLATGKIESNPLSGFTRELRDAIATIDLLLEVGYTPTTKNRHNETVVGSLDVAHGEGRIPIEWYEPIKRKYMTLAPRSAEVTLREICSKVSTAKEVLDKYRTLYCFGFLAAPEFAVKLALEFCMKLTPTCVGRGAFWTPVKEKLDMFRGMIESFEGVMKSSNPPQDYKDFRPAFVGWKSRNQLKLFNQLLSQYTLETIANIEREQEEMLQNPSQTEWRYDTCYVDPLAGVLGECANNTDKKAYIMHKLCSPETFHLALYCISHGKFVDREMAQAIATICETPEFEANSRLKFALYDVLEKLYKQKIKNIAQCISFLRTHSFSQVAEKSVAVVAPEPVKVVVEEFPQLDETHCESLKEVTKQIFSEADGAIDAYISKLRELARTSSTNTQCVVESFMARAFYDAYNSDKLEKISALVRICKQQRVFSTPSTRLAIEKMNRIELGDFFESSNLEDVKSVLATL